MSHFEILDVIASHPQIPTMFVTDAGTAIPAANTLNIFGGTDIHTAGAGNTVTISFVDPGFLLTLKGDDGVAVTPLAGNINLIGNVVANATHAKAVFVVSPVAHQERIDVQVTAGIVATDITKVGLAAFDSAIFTVDANGFVSSSGALSETFTGNSGGAVGPLAGNINTVGTGSITIVGNPGTHTLTTQLTGLTNHSVQVGAGTATLTQLTVGTNGQVLIGATAADPAFATLTSSDGSITFSTGANTLSLQVAGGTTVGKTITGNSGGALSPTAGNWNIFGASAAAGTTPVTTAGAVSTLTVKVQTAQAIAATDATKIGLCSFNSADFTVDANGFVSTLSTGVLNTLTGNSGGAISPTAGNINTVGTGSITIAGAGSTLTTQLTGLTNHSVQVGAGTATLTQLTVGTDGQVLIGASAANPAFATLTSSDGSVTFTTGANTLSLQVAGGTTSLKTLTGNSGGAISPTAGNINTLGTGSITIAGSGSTLTTQLTGLTNHAIQIGAGTATLTQLGAGTTGQVLQTNTGADPTWSTATYPSTTTINQILYSSSANVVAGLATANNGVLTTGTTGIPVITALASDGQVIIGSSAGAPTAATLSAGTGITITNGHNTISIAATNPSGFPWTDVTGATQTLAINNGYITDHSTTVVYTLPSTASIGDTIKIVGKLGLATITPNANQQILIGSASGTVGATGTAVSNNVGDCIELICITAGASTVWRAATTIGTWTLS